MTTESSVKPEKQVKSADSATCLVWLWLLIPLLGLDLGSKYLALAHLNYAEPNPVLPFFDLTLLFNTGAAFSFLADADGWQRWFFAGIALSVSVVLVIWLKRTARKYWWLGLGLASILAGALGNLYDRMVHGHVVDFISLHHNNYFFPAFNIADSAITLGAVLLVADMLFLEPKRKKEASI